MNEKNRLQKQLRRIKNFTDLEQCVVDGQKENWQQELQEKRSQQLQSLQHKKQQCQKDAGKCDGDMVRITDEIAEREVRLQELVQKSQRIHPAEADPDEEIRVLQAGDERRNSCASQTNGCCSDPAVMDQFITMGAGQARQQKAFIHGEVLRVYGGQHQQQQAPATPVHTMGGGEGREEMEEERRERAASRQSCDLGPPAPGGHNSGFPAGSVFDPAWFPKVAGEGDEGEFNSPRGRPCRSRSCTPVHSLFGSNSSPRK